MQSRIQGYGYAVLASLIFGFLVFRPLVDHFAPGDDETTRRHINLAVLVFAGLICVFVGMWADKKDGMNVTSARGWTTELFESRHFFFHVPLRLAGVLLFAASFLF